MVRLEGRFEGEGILIGSIARGYCTEEKSLGIIVQRGCR